jgi:Uma2 family endonuclease
MVALITDPVMQEQLIAQRQAAGSDRYDEVWEGVYVMAPLANDEHQDLVKELTTILTFAVDWAGLGKVRPGVNVSDQKEDWQHNYRCPDIVVFLTDTRAKNYGTHWHGGPDLAIEVVSPNDRSFEKLPFYAAVGTREVMLVERHPWAITLYRLRGGELIEAGRSTADSPVELKSEVVPLSWRLTGKDDDPEIEICHRDGRQRWSVRPTAG